MNVFLFADLTEEQVRDMIRHECGHVVVGRALGFPPGSIVLKPDSAGADSDHHLSFPKMTDAIEFIEKRLTVLYAGSVAQSLDGKGKCQPSLCKRFLETTASDDMSKIRELSRVLVGMKDPGLDQSGYEQKLASNDIRFSNDALKIVEANAYLINELVDAFVLGLKENIKATKTLSNTSLKSYTFTSTKIDSVIAKHPITLPAAI
ncbi:hypothetical protein SG09_56460 [Bradyrhizobium ottawaense]|uniref:hypothetical protein n=1 Tax=Bradyrhizobium TaxID=374 RepID=UPI00126047AC|nr:MULTISPECIES: hypothetical protein [Bradyrhizobium]BBO06296.1 hypothetical protein SG09_56460 [Bradyrhizobium ottawaense]BBO12563.1 hypothetical protein TM102_40330 [Bradyrhizobium sp. TM102]